jgi:membrane protein YdbS with pleckstrin-like domain
MLSEKEQEFINYWKSRREKEGRFAWQLLTGIPIGLLFSMPIFIIVLTGKFWYKRADMVAVSKLSPVVLVVAIVLIACFIAVFHRRVQWEKKEQQYLELLQRERQEGPG